MKNFRCGDVVAGCTATFAGTEDEILAAVAKPARQAHQMEALPSELVTQVRSAMQPA